MNGKEIFAGAVLLVTLAIGVVIDVFDRQPGGSSVPGQVCGYPAASVTDRDDAFRKLDLNTAGVEELDILPGIGPKKAGAIVEYRTRSGSFSNLCDLVEVKGIGEKTLERIRPYVFVSGEVSPAGD